jgi:uncharacterized protein (DUF2345 family)
MKKMRRRMMGLMGALVMSSLFVLGQAIPCHAETKLVESPPAAFANFGSSVSSSGNMVVVGVPGHDSYKGAAYVYKLNGTAWELTAELTAGEGAQSDMFGQSVSISGSTIVVGAPNNSATVNSVTIPYSGAAYVFKNNGSLWELSAKLTASDAATSDGFGVSVSVSGDTIVVGSPGQGDMDSGAAYVFTFNGTLWEQVAKLPQAPVDWSIFGQSVSISGDTIVVGARYDVANDGTLWAGAAYVFKHNSTGWAQMEKLTASAGDAAMLDNFGFSVSVSGNTIVVGAPGDEDNTGAAYVFALNGALWQQMAKFPLEGVGSSSYFGQSVAVSGETIVVGGYYDDVTDGPTDTGAAYLFRAEGTEWVVEKVTASDAAGGDYFGYSVSISGDTVIVGAPWKDDGSSEVSQVMYAGAAYVFILEGEPSIEFFVDIKPGSCVNPVNPKSKGVLPVAILGTEALDVMMVDPSTIRLSRDGVDGEVAPIRVHYADVATPMQCELTASGEIEGDGYTDLMLKFRTQEVVKALSLWDVAGERVTLILTANLKEEFGGTALSGQDDIKVLGKKPKPPKKPKK